MSLVSYLASTKLARDRACSINQAHRSVHCHLHKLALEAKNSYYCILYKLKKKKNRPRPNLKRHVTLAWTLWDASRQTSCRSCTRVPRDVSWRWGNFFCLKAQFVICKIFRSMKLYVAKIRVWNIKKIYWFALDLFRAFFFFIFFSGFNQHFSGPEIGSAPMQSSSLSGRIMAIWKKTKKQSRYLWFHLMMFDCDVWINKKIYKFNRTFNVFSLRMAAANTLYCRKGYLLHLC